MLFPRVPAFSTYKWIFNNKSSKSTNYSILKEAPKRLKVENLKHILLLNLRASTTSRVTCLRNKCFYGCNHPAISSQVITITNINSLWNSCPLSVQYKSTEFMQQSTELFAFHCYCPWFVFHAGPPPTPLIHIGQYQTVNALKKAACSENPGYILPCSYQGPHL